MPKFFFHMEDGADHPDREGRELSGLAAAQEYAVAHFATLLGESPRAFWSQDDWVMRVTDERGLVFFTLQFAATLSAAGQSASQRLR